MFCRLLAVAVAVVWAGACSRDGGGSMSDAAIDAGKDGGGAEGLPFDRYVPDWPGSCDPALQDCSGGQECVLDCAAKAFGCQAPSTGTDKSGASCTVGSCEKGLTCVRTSAMGTAAVCRKWCRLDSDCPPGKTCTTLGITCNPGDSALGWLCTP